MLSAFIFITFFAPSQAVLLVGQLLCGLPWGVFATTAPAYASEILPLPLRVYFTSYTNMCFIIGQLIGAGVLSGLQSRTDEVSETILENCILLTTFIVGLQNPFRFAMDVACVSHTFDMVRARLTMARSSTQPIRKR